MVVVKRHYRVSKRLTIPSATFSTLSILINPFIKRNVTRRIQGLGKVSKVKSHLRKPIREFEYLQVD